MSKMEDLTGQKFGLLAVLGINDERTQESRDRRKRGEITKSWIYWNCLCECENTTVVTTQKLTQHKTISCGCFRLKYDWNNIVNKRFGKWTVLEEVGNKKYLCICDCGTTKEVDGYNLVRGLSNDCGCSRLEVLNERNEVDLLGHKLGKLTVTKKRGVNKFNKRVWECQCECGNITYATTGQITGNHIFSCGCLTSKINGLMYSYCQELGYETIKEKGFYSNITNSTLRFDIYLPQLNLAIEYDGEQHYMPIDFGGKGQEWAEEQFKIQQDRDNAKNTYCQQNNINLLRIPYWEKDNVKSIIKNKINELLFTVND